jgi:hypothetical protein
MEGLEVTIVHRGGTTKRGVLLCFDDPKRPIVVLRFSLAGTYRANLNHGWLDAPAADWRIAPDDLAELRAWAHRTEHWVHPTVRRGPRPAKPKAAPPIHPKQLGFGWDDK